MNYFPDPKSSITNHLQFRPWMLLASRSASAAHARPAQARNRCTVGNEVVQGLLLIGCQKLLQFSQEPIALGAHLLLYSAQCDSGVSDIRRIRYGRVQSALERQTLLFDFSLNCLPPFLSGLH